jgi:WhiB family redox-sensing transcriptional regulator
MAARLIPSLSVPVPQATTMRDAGTAAALTDHSLETCMAFPPSSKRLVDLLDDLAAYGECRFDPELHTGPDSFTIEPPAERMAREDAARQVCEDCPVWDLCLEFALRLPTLPKGGIWAGHTARELAALRRQARMSETAA